jgi:hypothetical protein
LIYLGNDHSIRTFEPMNDDRKQKTIFIGMLLMPALLLLLEGSPEINAKGKICYEVWKSHYLVTRILLGVLGLFGFFFFRNWFFKVLVLVVMLLTIMGTYVTGWIWADVNC